MSDRDPAAEADVLRQELATAYRDLNRALADRDRAQDRAMVLRNELQHRVRNMLATVRSIFSRTMESGGVADDLADHFRGRLDTLARLQSASAAEPNMTIDVERLIRDEFHGFQFGDDPRIDIAGDDVRVASAIAQVMALAIHELVTNSLKFGVLARNGGRGRLTVRWAANADTLQLEWQETGVAVLAQAPFHTGFGREFIEQALPYQIGAITAFELRPGGLRCTIAVPLGGETATLP